MLFQNTKTLFQMHPLLNHVAHRPYPLSPKPWIMAQTWVDLLFMHWPVSTQLLRPFIPECLEVDSFEGTGWIGSGAMSPRFEAIVRPSRKPYFAKQGGLEAWLLERYCFFTLDHAKKLCIGEIHHKQWQMQQAEVEVGVNTLVEAIGMRLPSSKPHSHFVSNLETIVWTLSSCA